MLKQLSGVADAESMGRSLIGFSAMVGGTVASFAPELWGGSAMSLASIFCGFLGGIAGVYIGYRLSSV